MNIYFAAPLFSQAERSFNIELTHRLEALGFDVFLPQRDGVEADKPPYDTMSKEERRRAMFELDRDKIIASDIFLFILDGRVPDEGAAVELGIAYMASLEQPKKIVGFHSDDRAAFMGAKLNPMLYVPLKIVVDNEIDLINYLVSDE